MRSNRDRLPRSLRPSAPYLRDVRRMLADPGAMAALFGVTRRTALGWRRKGDLPLARWAQLAGDGATARKAQKAVSVPRADFAFADTRFSYIREARLFFRALRAPSDLTIALIIASLRAVRLPRAAQTYQYIVSGSALLTRDESVNAGKANAYNMRIVSVGSKRSRWAEDLTSRAMPSKDAALHALTLELKNVDANFEIERISLRTIDRKDAE